MRVGGDAGYQGRNRVGSRIGFRVDVEIGVRVVCVRVTRLVLSQSGITSRHTNSVGECPIFGSSDLLVASGVVVAGLDCERRRLDNELDSLSLLHTRMIG